MANLAQIAGAYSFTFVGDLGWHSAADLANSTLWSTVAGVIWIAVMTCICYRGIEVSARLQYGLLSIEVVLLIVTLPRRADLLLEPAVASPAHFGLPDSGDMPTVISPDLSNLPAGEKAIDKATGEEFSKG
jgi:hypothetical protein